MTNFNVIQWLRGSADNAPGGASSKKLTAFWALVIVTTPVVFLWAIWAYTHNDWTQLPTVLTAMVAFVTAGLGINMVEKIKDKSNNEKDNNTTNDSPTN